MKAKLRKCSQEISLVIHYRNLNARPIWQALAQMQLKRLQSQAVISNAHIILERQHDAVPAYRAAVLLEVPGPDFHAEAADHTMEAAFIKAVNDLERQIRSRKRRRLTRSKSNPSLALKHRHSQFAFGGRM